MNEKPQKIKQPSDGAPMVEYALYYASMGFPVFRTYPRTKEKYYYDGKHLGKPNKKYPKGSPYSWQAQATTDPDRIRAYWKEAPNANICIPTGNRIYVVDVDKREDGNGFDSIAKWESDKSILDGKFKLNKNTWHSITGSGSSQYFYFLPQSAVKKAADKGINLSGSADVIETGSKVDTRGDNRYVMVPPSIHPNGQRYKWDADKNPENTQLADMDESVYFLFTQSRKRKKQKNKVKLDEGELIPHGSRREWLLQICSSYVNRNLPIMSEDAIVAAVMVEAHKHLDTSVPFDSGGWDSVQRDVEKIVSDFVANDTKSEPRKNMSPQSDIDLSVFHRFSKEDKNGLRHPIDTIDVEICKYICENNHIMINAGQTYLYEHGVFILDEDGRKIKRKIKELIYPELIKNTRVEGVYKLLIGDPTLHIEEINRYPEEWINFRNGMLDPKSLTLYEHKPEYYSVNQIPLEWIAGEVDETGTAYRFIKDRIPDDDDREMYLEAMGTTLNREPSQEMDFLTGGSGNGKSTLLNLHSSVVGDANISGVSLQDLNKRFYPTCLKNKLVNICADIPSKGMDSIDVLKKLTGEDVIMGEYKGGDVFWFRSYAKLVFSANTLPKSFDDRTNAYYRRLRIIEIGPKNEHFDNLVESLYMDRQNYLRMIVYALHRMYERGYLLKSQGSNKRVEKLHAGTDTVYDFIEEYCLQAPSFRGRRKEIYEAYLKYCECEGRRPLTAFRFREDLENKGYAVVKMNGYDSVKGLEVDKVTFSALEQQNPHPDKY